MNKSINLLRILLLAEDYIVTSFKRWTRSMVENAWTRFGTRRTHVQILLRVFISSAPMGRWIHLFVPQFPHL